MDNFVVLLYFNFCTRAVNSAGECNVDIVEVGSSILPSPIRQVIIPQGLSRLAFFIPSSRSLKMIRKVVILLHRSPVMDWLEKEGFYIIQRKL